MAPQDPTNLPTFQQREAMWSEIDFPHAPGSFPQTLEYVQALRERFANGQVHFNSFSVPRHPILDWHWERHAFYGCNFFERFWRARAL